MKTGIDLATVYNLYVDDLFTYGCYLGFENEIVKDAIHDVFVRITSNDKILNQITHIKFYLFKSLKNRLYDIHKGMQREVPLENIQPLDTMPFNIEVNVEDNLIEKEEQLQLDKEELF